MTGEEFKRIRKSAGLTQEEVAEMMGHKGKIWTSHIETGKLKLTKPNEMLFLYLLSDKTEIDGQIEFIRVALSYIEKSLKEIEQWRKKSKI